LGIISESWKKNRIEGNSQIIKLISRRKTTLKLEQIEINVGNGEYVPTVKK
jgi:hypothetical protein